MWLDKLEQAVRTLADRIKQHRHVLQGNEQATRYALIDPLLGSLGWNLADPSEVVAEYRLDADEGRVDYAMLHGGEPYLLIEAKNLGERLKPAVLQVVQYALATPAQFVVLTNGEQWEGYDLGARNKQVFEFNISRPGSALDLLWLWHGNFKGTTTQPTLPRRPADDVATPASTTRSSPSLERAASGVPLPDYKIEMGKPCRLIFPNGETKDVSKNWWNVQAATAEWLIDHHHVTSLPLQTKRGVYLLHREPTTQDGKPFKNAREVRKGYWINTNHSALNHCKKAVQLLDSCDVNPHEVRVELA